MIEDAGSIVLDSEIGDDLAAMELRGRKAHEEIAERTRNEQHDRQGFGNGLAAVKSLFSQITDAAHVDGAAALSKFHDGVAETVNNFNKAVLSTSEATDRATLGAKAAIQEQMGKDNIDFKAAVSRSLTQLQIIANEQARLHMEMADKAGTDGLTHGNDALQTVLANQKAVAALMEKMHGSVDAIAGKATKHLSEAVTTHDRDRSALKAALDNSLKELEEEQHQAKRDFHTRIELVHTQAVEKEEAMHAAIQGMTAAMGQSDRHAQHAEGEEKAIIEQNERHIVSDLQGMMLKQKGLEMSEESEQERESMMTRNVDQVLSTVSKRVDKDAERAETQATDQIHKLEPTQQSSALKAEVSQLSSNFQDELKKTTQLEDDSESEAVHLEESSTDAVAKGIEGLAKLAPGIQKEQDRRDRYFEDLNDTLATDRLDVDNELGELNELALDMKVAMANKGNDVKHKMHLVEDEVAKLNEMTKYANAGQLDRIIETLLVGVNQTDDIHGMVEQEVKPKTKDLRKRTGQIFEDNGMSLNMDRIDAMGNQTMQEEMSMRARLLAAREGLEDILHETARKTQGELTSVYEETKHLIAEVEAMAHLSEAEKAARIRDIKADAARKTAAIMARSRATIQNQMKATHGMETKERDIKVLLQRAKSLSSGEFQTTDKKTLKGQLEAVKARDQDIRDKWITAGGASLLEEHARLTADQAAAAEERWTPARELRGDLADAENLALHRESEDRQLEDELKQLRSVSS